MSGSDQKKSSQQEAAIHDYLQGLLQEATEPEIKPVIDAELVAVKAKTVGLEALIAEIPEIVVQPKIEIKPAEKIAMVEEPVAELVTEPDFIVPEWAQSEFQCLLFKVSGLTLAVPLIKLNGVIPWPQKITETPNQTDWFLGLVPNQDINVKVIDTALLVVPENRRGNIIETPSERFSHIILVDDGRWGLACDSIGDVVWLNQDKVKWRKNKVQRPWLEGTALDYLCALLNTEAFADMLNEKMAS